MRLFWFKLRQWFCWHEMGMLADWSPEEICIHVGCPKCGKIAGHFHLPTISPKSKETVH